LNVFFSHSSLALKDSIIANLLFKLMTNFLL